MIIIRPVVVLGVVMLVMIGVKLGAAIYVEGPWDKDIELENTSRTEYNLDHNLFFFSQGKRYFWGNDLSFVAKYINGKFEFQSYITTLGGRCVMPSSAYDSTTNRWFVAARRIGADLDNFIEIFVSDDNCT